MLTYEDGIKSISGASQNASCAPQMSYLLWIPPTENNLVSSLKQLSFFFFCWGGGGGLEFLNFEPFMKKEPLK